MLLLQPAFTGTAERFFASLLLLLLYGVNTTSLAYIVAIGSVLVADMNTARHRWA